MSSANADHEFHLSKCDIEYNIEETSYQLSMSVFIDDLEQAILEEYGVDSLFICTKNEAIEAEQQLFTYITKHFTIVSDGKKLPLTFVGKEISEDLAAVWVYCEVKAPVPEKEIIIKNDILMKQFKDQQNVVKLEMEGMKKQFFLFNYKEFSGTVSL